MNIQHTFIRARKSFFVGKIGLFSVVRITSNVRPFQSTPKTLAAEKGATSSAQSTTMRFFQRFVFGNQYGLVAHKLYEKTVAQAERNDLWKGKDGKKCSDSFSEFFWKDVEKRMIGVGLTNPTLVSKETKNYSKMYYGALVAYDEALLFKSDTLLGEALWRNVFGMSRIPTQRLTALVQYVRKEMFMLDKRDAKTTLMSGSVCLNHKMTYRLHGEIQWFPNYKG